MGEGNEGRGGGEEWSNSVFPAVLLGKLMTRERGEGRGGRGDGRGGVCEGREHTIPLRCQYILVSQSASTRIVFQFCVVGSICCT